MAFSILSAFIWGHRTKYVSAPTKTEDGGTTRVSVLRTVYPSKRLIDQADPHEYVGHLHTDIRRWKK